ncbi:unnamed protein product [Nesidiocoris tenuis]|uniref:GLTSCR protein conserved domain-containing protein n=1 Tax=Nesidiocoris tenuis TaxID=355587 RepID=A0A6H5GG42_9HEMI|nr:unnamed protein product [Nesidiocoris tenuis]
MLPNGAVLVQQQTSSGVQFILKSPHPQQKHGLVLANGGIHQPQAVIVQGRHQAHQVLRLVPGQMQLQQIQTSSGPTLIAVPAQQPAPQPAPRAVSSPQAPQTTAITFAHKKLKKKKKREDEQPAPPTHRLDLANLIKISGIEDDDVICSTPVSSASTGVIHQSAPQSIPVQKTPPPQPASKTLPSQQSSQQQHQQLTAKHFNPSQLLAQLQSPAQAVGVTPSIAAAAQSQLAQLIADHGCLQTAVLQIQGAGAADGMVLKGIPNHAGSVVVNANQQTTGNIRRTPVVMAPTATIQQNGVRYVTDINGTLQQASSSLTEHHNRLIMSAGLTAAAPSVLEQNRVQIVTGVPTTMALEQQQNRVQIVTAAGSNVLTQQGRVLVSAGSLEQHHQNHRVQIVTSNSSAVSLTEQNRVIVSNVPNNVSLDQQHQQHRLQFVSAQNSLHVGEQQNRVIVSGMQGNMTSLSEQNRVQIVAGGGPTSGMALEQNRVQIVSGQLQNSTNTLSLSEQNRVHIVSNVPNSNISLSEKQNLVQFVNSNISLSEEQNRVQIVTSMANQIPDQNRLHFVNSLPQSNSMENHRVQLVANVPTVTNSFALADNVLVATSVSNSMANQNKIHFSSMTNSNSSQPVQIVTSMPNDNKVQVVTSLPSFAPVVEQAAQSNKVHFAFKNHVSTPLHQKRNIIANFHNDHSNVQVVSALVNNTDKDSFQQQVPQQQVHHQQAQQQQQPFAKRSELRVISGGMPGKEKEIRQDEIDGSKMLAALDPSLGLCSSVGNTVNSLSDQSRVQYVTNSQDDSRIVQVVGATNHHTSVISQGNQVRTSVVYSHDMSPKTAKSPGSAGFTSPINSPMGPVPSPSAPSPAPASLPSPSPSPAPSAFNNRPNLTVVTGPTRSVVEVPKDPNSHLMSSTSKTSQVNSQPRRTYDNAFLDSIAQAHPSLVINKSSPPQGSKLTKGKKLVKKAALVKPMMAEDRTIADKEDPPNLVAINSTGSDLLPLPNGPTVGHPQGAMPPAQQAPSVVNRVQTIQLTLQKQQVGLGVPQCFGGASIFPQGTPNSFTIFQQLKAIQAQVASLTANKFRSPAEQAALQRLVSEQRKILLGGKVIPTVPGQHAQGVAFVSANSSVASTMPSQVRVQCSQAHTQPPAQAAPAPRVATASMEVQTPITMSSPHVPQSQPASLQAVQQQSPIATKPQMSASLPAVSSCSQPTAIVTPPVTPTHAHKSTSPIPTQVTPGVDADASTAATANAAHFHASQASSAVSEESAYNCYDSKTLAEYLHYKFLRIDQQYQADRQGALNPDTHTPFANKADAVKRLIRYHTLNEPVLSEKDLSKADEIFEQTAQTLLDRKAHMYNKFAYLLLKDSMRLEKTSEVVLLYRLAKEEEIARNEQMAQAAQSSASPSTSSTTEASASTSESSASGVPTTSSQPPSATKRDHDQVERTETDNAVDSSAKKHCPDDDEISAQVQSAIDSILNLQRKPPP